jgi:hypothetical protein
MGSEPQAFFSVLVHPLLAKEKFLSFHPWIEREDYPPSTVPVVD